MSQIEIRNVSFAYGDKKVLKDISLTVDKGEVVSIVGESGVGKTTLFNVIAGVLGPDQGDVLIEDTSISNQTGHISYMLQKDLLLPFKTIKKNLALPLILKGINKDEAYSIVENHLPTFGLTGTQEQYPDELSGGMRQRAALLRTYLFGKNAMLLDEPFSALDPLTKEKMHQWYMDVMSEIETTTLFITHDIDEAIFLSDKIYIMKGSPATLLGPIPVKFAKKRLRDVSVSEEFLKVKKEVYDILYASEVK